MAVDPEAAYYQAIEEFFVSRRGDPLFLSSADWLLIRKWRQQGVPLRVVLRGIADALDAHAHSWSRARKVGSLAYCANEVEAARDRWRRALAVGGEAALDVARGLERLAASLAHAQGLGPRSASIAEALAKDLAGIAVPLLSEVEPRLAAAEKELLVAIAREDGESVAAAVEREVEDLLAPYRGRMPARVLEQIREDSKARRFLERHRLPRISLFHLEGSMGEEEESGGRR